MPPLDWAAVPSPTAPVPSTVPEPPRPPRRIVLLAGPSGSGKGEVARRSGLPTLELDSFYREAGDPGLPRRFGIVDWDDPASWRAGAALAALTQLAHEGAAVVPTYSIATSSRTGSQRLELGQAPLLIAEGIFAAKLIEPLAAAGLLADAIVLDRPLPLVLGLRITRDLREHRKSLPVLLRRNLALAGDQRSDVRRWRGAGMRPLGLRQAVRRVHVLAGLAEADRRIRVQQPRSDVLRITAVCFLRDGADGPELLCVRKRGTGSWMQVGGKLEPGESSEQAAIREVAEELGVALTAADLDLLGDFEAVAANEPGTTVHSTVFTTRFALPEPLQVRAELAEHQWIPVAGQPADQRESTGRGHDVGRASNAGGRDGGGRDPGRLAPLMRQHILPALRDLRSAELPDALDAP